MTWRPPPVPKTEPRPLWILERHRSTGRMRRSVHTSGGVRLNRKHTDVVAWCPLPKPPVPFVLPWDVADGSCPNCGGN